MIGKNNHQVIVKHDGSLIRVHPVSIRLVEEHITCGDMAGGTEMIVNGEEDNAENADLTEAPNSENVQ